MTDNSRQKNDGGNVPVTNEELRALEAEIDQALQNARAEQFRALIKKHSRMVHQLLSLTNSPQIPPDAPAKTAEKYREWIRQARQLLKNTRDKIDNLQPLKNTRRQISNAYSGQTSKAGNLISRKG